MGDVTWTLAALARHFDVVTNLILARITEMNTAWERATSLALENARLERERASDQVDSRLEGMNEFRSAMKDQAAKFVTRRELWAYLAAMVAAVSAIITAVIQLTH